MLPFSPRGLSRAAGLLAAGALAGCATTYAVPLGGYSPLRSEGDVSLGASEVHGDELVLSQRPGAATNAVSVTRDFTYDLGRTLWFEFLFRVDEALLGADMYTSLGFGGDLWLTIGINGEQHYRAVHFEGHGRPCLAKDQDDEFFISVASGLFPGAGDVRIRYPRGTRNPYTEWTAFAVRYDPPRSAGGVGRFSFYVDGREAPLDNIDAPGQTVRTTTAALAGRGQTRLHATFLILTDGAEHGYTGNKFGVRGRGCYTPLTPARPAALVVPTRFAAGDGLAAKAPWMHRFDEVAELIQMTAREAAPAAGVSTYQRPRSAASPMYPDYIGPAHPAGPGGVYETWARIFGPRVPGAAAARGLLERRIRDAVQAGHTDLETAVLMGALALPATDDPLWAVDGAPARAAVEAAQARLGRQPEAAGVPAERFVWDAVGRAGGWAEAVHLGYLLPESVRASAQWARIPADERAQIPAAPEPRTAVMRWRAVRIDSQRTLGPW